MTAKHNLKFTLDKLQFNTKQASFSGTTFTSECHKPEDDQGQAISKM